MFLSKIEWNSLVGFESSNKNLKFRGLGKQICLFSKSAYTKWTPNGSREVLFREFETSVQNSTTGDGMALDKQV